MPLQAMIFFIAAGITLVVLPISQFIPELRRKGGRSV